MYFSDVFWGQITRTAFNGSSTEILLTTTNEYIGNLLFHLKMLSHQYRSSIMLNQSYAHRKCQCIVILTHFCHSQGWRKDSKSGEGSSDVGVIAHSHLGGLRAWSPQKFQNIRLSESTSKAF